MEATIEFDAQGGAVLVQMNLPDPNEHWLVQQASGIASDLSFQTIDSDGVAMGRWRGDALEGPQIIYARTTIHSRGEDVPSGASFEPETFELQGVERSAATSLVQELSGPVSLESVLSTARLLHRINDRNVNDLLREYRSQSQRTWLVAQLLTLRGFRAQVVSGVVLDPKSHHQLARDFVEVKTKESSFLVDCIEIELMPWSDVLLFTRGQEPLFEVYGGKNSDISFVTFRHQRAAFTSAVESAKQAGHPTDRFLNIQPAFCRSNRHSNCC